MNMKTLIIWVGHLSKKLHGPKINRIVPSVSSVSADIIIGQKYFLAYIFKPVRIFALQALYEKMIAYFLTHSMRGS